MILINQFCEGGTLEDFLINLRQNYPDGIPEAEAIGLLREIAEGFFEMQKYKIIHRDLKLANILIRNNHLVIADFGFAKIGVSFTDSKLGTPYYMAPEVLD